MAKFEFRKDMDVKTMVYVIKEMLHELSDMDVDLLTTFELKFIRTFSDKMPKAGRGCEERISDE